MSVYYNGAYQPWRLVQADNSNPPSPSRVYKFSESSGSAVADSSGNGKDGTITGTLSVVDGQFDKARVLAGGTSNYFKSDNSLTANENTTLYLRVKFTNDTSGLIYARNTNDTNVDDIFLSIEPTYALRVKSKQYAFNFVTSANVVKADYWHWITLIIYPTDDERYLYVDGHQEAYNTSHDISIYAYEEHRIGYNNDFADTDYRMSAFNGTIDEMVIYNGKASTDYITKKYGGSLLV